MRVDRSSVGGSKARRLKRNAFRALMLVFSPRGRGVFRSLGIHFQKFTAAGLVMLLLGLTACDTWPKAHLTIPAVSPLAYQTYKTKIDQNKNIFQQRCVFIDGQDIQLPLTAGQDDLQQNRTYSFYVWAWNPDHPLDSLDTMRRNGTFSLEVVGAKAAISVPNYLPASCPPAVGECRHERFVGQRPAKPAKPQRAGSPHSVAGPHRSLQHRGLVPGPVP